jgi:cytosine/adenosine deaminase-related metal-dependent hydrolase
MPGLLLRDGRPWSAGGSGDLLERAMHLAYRSTFRRDEDIEAALEAVTFGGARALGLDGYGLTRAHPPTSWWSTRKPRPTRS